MCVRCALCELDLFVVFAFRVSVMCVTFCARVLAYVVRVSFMCGFKVCNAVVAGVYVICARVS